MLSPALLPGYVEPGKSGLHPTAAARSVWLLPRPLNPCVFTRVSRYLISWDSKPRNWLGSPLRSRTREEEKGVTRRRAAAVGDLPQESLTLTCPAPCGARHAEMQLQTLNPLWAPDGLPRAALWRTRRSGANQTEDNICSHRTRRGSLPSGRAAHTSQHCGLSPSDLWSCPPSQQHRPDKGDYSQGPYWCITEVRKGKRVSYNYCSALWALCWRRGRARLEMSTSKGSSFCPPHGAPVWLLSLLSGVSLSLGWVLRGDVRPDESWFN